jgi:transglutaminase-like putative cysteine protease
MKRKIFYRVIGIAVLILAGLTVSSGSNIYVTGQDSIHPEKAYYAVEVNDVVCGYFEATETHVQKGGKNYIQADANVFVMLYLLGSQFNNEIQVKSLLEPDTRKAVFTRTDINQGSNKMFFEAAVEDNKATLSSSLREDKKIVELRPNVLVGSDQVTYEARKVFLENKLTEAEFEVLETMEEEIQMSSLRKIGEETLELAGRTYKAVIIEQTNSKTGLKTKYWISPDYPDPLKFEVQNRKIYLADRSVVDKIKVANMDAAFFTKSNVSISDFQAITYMKLNVIIEPTGVVLKNEDLNGRGQKFFGTVKDNVVEGIVEIENIKYDGNNAPPFPPQFSENKSLKKYLSPDQFIQSGDPDIVKKAKEITDGSKDSWDAANRLSKWVAENIGYAIPGGGNAKRTYEIRAGECGAHSMLLAAFCRAVGIPARIVFGAMYAPNFGGGFGQHGWNEIYMGDAGWIPVDATAHEIDYIDAGHIRISEVVSMVSSKFNGKKIEIIEYKLGDKSIKAAAKTDYSPYLGKYVNIDGNRTFTVVEKEGNLSLDIPGQMVLPFNPENEKGRWICKIAPQISMVFNKNDGGKINGMVFHQIVPLTRRTADEEVDNTTPEEFIPYVGKYLLASANIDFTVMVVNGSLAVYDPTQKDTVLLQKPDADGGWLDEYNKNTIYFTKDAQGNVTDMKIDVTLRFKRGELASDIVDKIIESEGMESGLRKYDAMKKSGVEEIIFTEGSFNQLGYKYLNAGKIKEATEIFKLNAGAYPESFNVYDSLGEVYMKSGENDLAVKNYNKSLELNPKNDNAKKMLETLGIK